MTDAEKRPPGANDPDAETLIAARDETVDAVVAFARALRRSGVSVPANAAVEASRALAAVGLTDRSAVRAATRATLISRREDIETFDRLFERFWRALQAAGDEPPEALADLADAADVPAPADEDRPAEIAAEDASEAGRADDRDDEGTVDESAMERHETRFAAAVGENAGADDDDGERVTRARYSPSGRAEQVSTGVGLGIDRRGLEQSVERLTRALATLPGRRREPSPDGRYLDARRALRGSFQTGGVVASVPETEPARQDVRGLVLADVSQSVLDAVDREFLLEWLRLLVAAWRSTRVFFFDTDVREVTDAVDERSVGDVTDALARAEAGWGGGTRIGHALATIREEYPEAVDRRTVVIVVSDGLERGDVDRLAESAAWIGRRADRFLWLNPLATSPAYEPTARGMAAALPAVDGLFAFADAADVAEIARQLERHDRTRLGYEYDPRRAEPGSGRTRERTAVTDGGRATGSTGRQPRTQDDSP